MVKTSIDDYVYNFLPVPGVMWSFMDSGRLLHLREQLNSTIMENIDGDVVELGCNIGTSAILLKLVLDYHESNKELHVYDSFEGLESVSKEIDGAFWRKGLFACDESDIVNNFIAHGCEPPIIHKGWFKDTLPTQLPDKISLAHLDGDTYQAIKESLEYVYPKMSKDGVIVVDDYNWRLAPGCVLAVNEFFEDKEEDVISFDNTDLYPNALQARIVKL